MEHDNSADLADSTVVRRIIGLSRPKIRHRGQATNMALTGLEVRSAKGRERPYKVGDSGGIAVLGLKARNDGAEIAFAEGVVASILSARKPPAVDGDELLQKVKSKALTTT